MKLNCKGLVVSHDQHTRFCFNQHFESGKAYALMGRSGVGKSTFLDAIAGFLPLEQGSLNWQGQEISQLAVSDRPMSLLLQNHNLFAHLSAQKNIDLVLPRNQRSERQAQVVSLVQALGLGLDLLKKKPSQLSGGQQQRVALCRNLLLDRPIMLLDEPFSGLDHGSRTLAYQVLKQWLSPEKLIILVTHDPDDAQSLGAEIVEMESVLS